MNTPSPDKIDARFLELLASLNEIGAAINRIGTGDRANARSALQLIVESAIRVIPGASAFIYTYDTAKDRFEVESRAAAGNRRIAESTQDGPRPEGLGMRAIRQRHHVFSYDEPDLEMHPMLSEVGAKVVACFPLIVVEQPVGGLYVYLYEERHFTQLEQLMLENLVNQAAIAIFQMRRLAGVQRDLSRKEEELRHLRRAGLLISSRLKLEDTLEVILQMALEVTRAQYGIFRLVDSDGQHLITRAIAGEQLAGPRIEVLPLKQAGSVMSWVALNRRPALIRDLHEPPWSDIYYPLDANLEMRAELAVPVIGASGRLEGVLNLESPQVGAFDEDDRRLLQSLASQAVIAIQEVRLLDALQEAARWVVSQPYLQALERLTGLGRELLNAFSCQVQTIQGSDLVLQASNGERISDDMAPLVADLQRKAIQSGNLEVLESPARSRRVWTIPLTGGDDTSVVGLMTIYGPAAESGQSNWDHKVLACLAYYAVLAVQNASHQQALKTAQEQRAVAETFAAVGDIAANLLHQLNNKIGAIPVRVQGIEDKCDAAVSSDRYLATNLTEIERSANEAMEAVRVNLSQLRPIQFAEVSVVDCVREALVESKVPEGVQIKMEDLDSLPAVLAGQRGLSWVFANLVQNAAEALGWQGTVVITGKRIGTQQVEVSVSDNGPGIPLEQQERIFEWNYSGRKANRSGGLGFGLWWVKTLMARLGGTVVVESDGQNGTTFHLRLPVVEKHD